MGVPFFWLHIKKAGGQSFRSTFSPPYVQTKRIRNFRTFIALPKEEWNDALNNYRVPLGTYDYKRMLFAKKYLYTEKEFSDMYKFTIVRNPYSRAVSCWKYVTRSISRRDIAGNPNSILRWLSFNQFLKDLPHLWKTKYDRHKATHTAPIWDDLTDENGEPLIDEIYKLEEMKERAEELCHKLGIAPRQFQHVNKNRRNKDYRKCYNSKTRSRVERLYQKDIKKLGYSF